MRTRGLVLIVLVGALSFSMLGAHPGAAAHGKATVEQLQPDFGLQWAEIGPLFRLPGYRSIAEVLSTAAVTGVRVVEVDLFLLGSAGSPFVDALHGFGLKVLGFTANDATDWFFMESLALDGIYTNDVPFGVANQAPIPRPLSGQHPESAGGDPSDRREPDDHREHDADRQQSHHR